MAVVSVNLRNQQSTFADNVLTAERIYVVIVDGPDDTSETARLACPGYGSQFTTGSQATCHSSKAEMVDNDPTIYLVTVDYKSTPFGTTDPNPLNQPAKYSYADSQQSQAFFRDRSPQPVGFTGYGLNGTDPVVAGQPPTAWTGRPCVNSAGEPWQDMPERCMTRGTITVTRNETGYDDSVAETWKNTVNSDAVTLRGVTYLPKTLLMGGISANGPNIVTFTDAFGVPTTVSYWEVSYSIGKNADTWTLNMEDRGLNLLWLPATATDPSQWAAILDHNGIQVALPYPLDGTGLPKPNATDQPAIIALEPYTARPFADHAFV